MNCIVRSVVAAGFFATAAYAFSAVPDADQKQATDQKTVADQKPAADQKTNASQTSAQGPDRWRYTFHNGEWWYWLPAGRWVYWRGDRWNDYHPKTYVAPEASTIAAAGRSGTTDVGRAANDAENRPFYGHAISDLDRRPLETNNDVGPFYGHALPTEVFGGWRSRRANRPFYGHAISSSGD